MTVMISEQSRKIHEMRMARLDESVASNNKYGLKVLYMHLSALSPTTRKSHAERHGKLFTEEQIRSFWANPSDIEGCKCSFTVITLDSSGSPLNSSIEKRARATYEKMKQSGYGWSL